MGKYTSKLRRLKNIRRHDRIINDAADRKFPFEDYGAVRVTDRDPDIMDAILENRWDDKEGFFKSPSPNLPVSSLQTTAVRFGVWDDKKAKVIYDDPEEET